MDLDTLLIRYFGTADPGAVGAETLASGIARCQVDLGLEQDRGKRFALWAMLYLFGAAPDLEAVFAKQDERDAARTFMDLLAAGESDAGE